MRTTNRFHIGINKNLNNKDTNMTTLPKLTLEEMARKVPAVIATQPASKMSARYSFLPTMDVVNDIASLGWNPVAVVGARTNNESSRHVVRFQPSGELGEALAKHQSIPELVLVNSHNGTTSFKVLAGIFRLICSNGLVITEKQFAAISMKHMNYTIDEAVNMIGTYTKRLPNLVEGVDRMSSKQLTLEARMEFAKKVYAVREDIDAENESRIPLEHMLRPIRREDRETDLWTTYNLLQEKAIRGGYYRFNSLKNKYAKARAVTSVSEMVRVNTEIHALAESYL
jgi:hypothetical protein